MNFVIRRMVDTDRLRLNAVALSAFKQYQDKYTDWDTFRRGIGSMASLADSGAVIYVAEHLGSVVGGVGYVGPGLRKADFFNQSWPVIRMLVVQPQSRGLGIGKALTIKCVEDAIDQGCREIALHTASIMEVALSMYLKLGFVKVANAPEMHGVPYGVYLKEIHVQQASAVDAAL